MSLLLLLLVTSGLLMSIALLIAVVAGLMEKEWAAFFVIGLFGFCVTLGHAAIVTLGWFVTKGILL